MRLWQKIFFGTLVIVIALFDAGAWIITDYSYKFNAEREEKSCIRESGVILSSIQNGIKNAEKLLPGASQNKKNIFAVVSPLNAYYSPQGVSLFIFDGDNEVYSGGVSIDKSILDFENELNTNIQEQKIDGTRYLLAANRIPDFEHLTFVYARNISELDSYKQQIGTVFIWLNVAVLLILGISVFVLLKRITRPIKVLNETAGEIAGGAYDKRVSIKSGDELGELGGSFNKMAEAVEANINELTDAAESRQRFIDNLAHEMKTPMTAILGYSEYLQRADCGDEQKIIAAGHLSDSAKRLNSLSDSLLSMSMLRQAGLEKTDVDISGLFSALKETMRPILSAHNMSLETSCEIQTIEGDEALLLSLLTNLAQNAVRASDEGSAITVKVFKTEHNVIEVSDVGRGIAAEEIEKITEPFYRVDKSRSREFGGVGLGLSICKQIAALHGAGLEIESECGRGTTVSVYFTTS